MRAQGLGLPPSSIGLSREFSRIFSRYLIDVDHEDFVLWMEYIMGWQARRLVGLEKLKDQGKREASTI